MVTRNLIESFAASLVREYLSRKECKDTLKAFDGEMPRTEEGISNRPQLARAVHIDKIMKRNKETEQPFRSMIEVIVKFLIERATGSKELEGAPEQRANADVDKPCKRSSRPASAARRKESSGSSSSIKETPSPIIDQDFSGLPQTDRGLGGLQREPTTVVTMKDRPAVKPLANADPHLSHSSGSSISHEPALRISSSFSSSSSASSKKVDDPSKRTKRPGSASKSRGLAGPISSSLDAHDRRRSKKSTKSDLSPSLSAAAVSSSPTDPIGLSTTAIDDLSPFKKSTSQSSRSKLKNFGFDLSPDSTAEEIPKLGSGPTPKSALKSTSSSSLNTASNSILDEGLDGRGSPMNKEGRLPRHRRSFDESVDIIGSSRHEEIKPKSSPKKAPKKEVSSLGDVEMGDVDDLEDDLKDIQLSSYTPSSKRPIDSRPITLQLAVQLKSLIFGAGTGCFNDEWRLQGLGFNEISDLAYGIVQHKGGPCGVLASIQACMLQRLLFTEGSGSMTRASLKELPAKKRTDSLIQAIADIVWRAGQKKNAVIALQAPRAHFTGGGRYKADGLTETINLNLFKSRDEVQEFVAGNIRAFTESRGRGCILVLFSAIFSRTLEMVIEDMDDSGTKLLGAHGYCTQEMVNLILTGKAVSNVFNDVIELGSGKDVTKLKGLSGRSDIGLLSLFEHYKSCEVGTFYKTPRYPIWVVCSESHFSVLFSLRKDLIGDWKVERHFDLYYYDGLARQLEEIRLTVDTVQSCPPADNDELIPPLELCIRTKWPEATVDWNGSEPIL